MNEKVRKNEVLSIKRMKNDSMSRTNEYRSNFSFRFLFASGRELQRGFQTLDLQAISHRRQEATLKTFF